MMKSFIKRPKTLALGLAVASPLAYKLIFAVDQHGNPLPAREWQISAYRLIPLRMISRMWGHINSITLPEWFRPIGYKFYSKLFNVNLAEMKDPNLKNFPNLGDFFFRELKEGARPIADSELVSPCDGKILELGTLVNNEKIEKVKGVSYTAEKLLGEPSKSYGKNKLFYCVIYLAPGDYHRFHSPCDFKVKMRRHFVGDLFSVAPYFQSRLTDLFCLNERVALLGSWKHGFFSMTPVGATNVGSIVLNFDNVKTNQRGKRNVYENALNTSLLKGDEMGGFRLGSTVVLVFEAPNSFQFAEKVGEVVKMGETLGTITSK